MEEQLYSFLSTRQIGYEWLNSRPGRFTTGTEPRYPLNRRLRGPQSRSALHGEEKNLFPMPGFETRILHPVA